MAFLAYAVVGGYYHYTPLLHAVAWGFAGWVLFFSGMNLVQQYPAPQQQSVAPQAPPQMVPSHDTHSAGWATPQEIHSVWDGRKSHSDEGTVWD
jgi:hypothetical protein